MTTAELIAKYTDSLTGLFKDNVTRDILEETIREFVIDVTTLTDLPISSAAAVDSLSVSTSGGTITLNCDSKVDRIFVGSASFAAPKTVALSNDSNALRLTFIFEITDVAAIITFPNTFRMSEATWGANGAYTWTALDVGTYKVVAEFNGTLWYAHLTGPYGFIT